MVCSRRKRKPRAKRSKKSPRAKVSSRPKLPACEKRGKSVRQLACREYFQCFHPTLLARNNGQPDIMRDTACLNACGGSYTPSPKIAFIIINWNEGEWPEKTVEAIRASSVLDRHIIILVDDGSTDGSCDFVAKLNKEFNNVTVLTPRDAPIGVGNARNFGFCAALLTDAEVFIFLDAHMTAEKHSKMYNKLAEKALTEDCIVVPRCVDIDKGGGGRGCDIFWNFRNELNIRWRYQQEEEWKRVACMMGACYVISRATASKLTLPTGQLWEDIAGRWGFSEQSLSVKAFLLDIPIYASRDLKVKHKFRSSCPTPNIYYHVHKNAAFSLGSLLSKECFEERFLPFLLPHFNGDKKKADLDRILASLPTTIRSWDRAKEEKMFTHLFGCNPPVVSPHPDHAWLTHVAQTAYLMSPERILVWRPGEATILLRRICPDAEIIAIEFPGIRTENWRRLAPGFKVDLRTYPLWANDYVNAPRKWGKFDLVLVNGERQEECMAVAKEVGNIVITNELADLEQIDSKEREQEKKKIVEIPAVVKEKMAEVKLAAPGVSPILTVCLLNYERQKQYPALLDNLNEQTIPLQVYLWNNGPPIHDLRIALTVDSSRNIGCPPRWLLASLANTEYVCSMDDDLLLADPHVLSDAITACEQDCRDGVVGFFGWSRKEGADYKNNKWKGHINGSNSNQQVDLIKGRFMLFRRALLQKVPLVHPAIPDPSLLFRCDDINICYSISEGKRTNLVPGILGKRWRDVGSYARGLAAGKGHYQERDLVITLMEKHYNQLAEANRQITGTST